MNRLNLTGQETELMQGILKGYLVTLDVEIDHADHKDFKRMLKERRYVVNDLLERCSSLPTEDGVPQQGIFPSD
jgi:hypothetical protein